MKDLVGKKVGVSAPGSSTDFFLKYLLRKSGVDPSKTSVVGIGNGATSVAAMEQNQVDALTLLRAQPNLDLQRLRNELQLQQPELLAKLDKMLTTAREPTPSYEESRARRQ